MESEVHSSVHDLCDPLYTRRMELTGVGSGHEYREVGSQVRSHPSSTDFSGE